MSTQLPCFLLPTHHSHSLSLSLSYTHSLTLTLSYRLARQAFDDDCHYFYQLNDDIRFITPHWTHKFVTALRLNPVFRDLGVTGPTDVERRFYLTQSFVSRVHLSIFGTDGFYPHVFKNWYSDNWISDVYRPSPIQSFFHHSSILISNTNERGMRYIPAQSDRGKLDAEVERGARMIKAWMVEQKLKRYSKQN
jgi:hypothetical protein